MMRNDQWDQNWNRTRLLVSIYHHLLKYSDLSILEVHIIRKSVEEEIDMEKIKDRNTLAIASGMIGLSGILLVDEISRRVKISQRSYRVAAAGMFLSKREAMTLKGQALGVIMNSAVSIIGAKYIINELSKTGRDNVLSKGVLTGVTFGAIATAIPNIVPKNNVKPKDAASNLSYIFTNLVYGLITTFAAAKLGHDSLFDTPPQNDYIKPTEQTSEEKQLIHPDVNQPLSDEFIAYS